jgi:hypothetical protein
MNFFVGIDGYLTSVKGIPLRHLFESRVNYNSTVPVFCICADENGLMREGYNNVENVKKDSKLRINFRELSKKFVLIINNINKLVKNKKTHQHTCIQY